MPCHFPRAIVRVRAHTRAEGRLRVRLIALANRRSSVFYSNFKFRFRQPGFPGTLGLRQLSPGFPPEVREWSFLILGTRAEDNFT